MDWARLNVFQRLTRHWDALHPYNAAQAMKLAGRPDRSLLAAQWHATLRELGLGQIQLNHRRYRWELSERSEVIAVAPGVSINEFMTAELNRRFIETSEMPFRAFVLEEPDGYYAGVVYHHWVADSYSIRVLLREWFLRIHEPQKARRTALEIATRGYWSLFGPEPAKWKLDQALMGMVRWSANFRRARRVPPAAFRDFSVNFSLHRAPDGLIESVAAGARRCGVTVNDVFLAAMGQVCDEYAIEARTPRRHDVALGTIVDLRAHSKRKMDETFGLFLGFTSVFCRPEDLADFQRLLERVHRQNTMQKSAAAAQSSMMRMFAGLVVAGIFSQERLLEFYRKRFAMAGGISNVNLNRDWPARYHPAPLLDYVRVSPAGPMMPVVFTPTTLGRGLNFGLTCRQSVIPPQVANQAASMFLQRLRDFADSMQQARAI